MGENQTIRVYRTTGLVMDEDGLLAYLRSREKDDVVVLWIGEMDEDEFDALPEAED
jgi:hypothetical protein